MHHTTSQLNHIIHNSDDIDASALSSAIRSLNLHISDHPKAKIPKIVKFFTDDLSRLLEVNPEGTASINVGEADLDKVEAYLTLQHYAEGRSDRKNPETGLVRPVSMVEMSELAEMQDFDDAMKQASNKSLFMESSLGTEVTSASSNDDDGNGDDDGFLFYDDEEDKKIGGGVPFRVPVPSAEVESCAMVPSLNPEAELISECAPEPSGMMRRSHSFAGLATSVSVHSRQFKPSFSAISEIPSGGPILRECTPPLPVERPFDPTRRPSKSSMKNSRSGSALCSVTDLNTMNSSYSSINMEATCNMKRNVSFSCLEIREYMTELGDNPSCSSGPPICLSWDPTSSVSLCFETYESNRPPRRRKEQMQLPPSARFWRLKRENGYTSRELIEATKAIQRIQKSRVKNSKNTMLVKVEEAWESAGRKAKRLCLLIVLCMP